MAFFLYNIYRFLSGILYPFLYLLLKIRIKNGKEDKVRWKEKLGFYKTKRPVGKLIWLHAASIGELKSCTKLVEILLRRGNVLITSGTLTSAEIFTKLHFKKTEFEIMHQFAPLDSIAPVQRFLKHFKPDISCFIESEIWPNLLHESAKISKVFSVNTRISTKSLTKWKQRSYLFKWILKHFEAIIPSTKMLASELSKITKKNIIFLGNLKYDTNYEINDEKITILKGLFSTKVVLFASTHEGEETLLLPTFKQLLSENLSIILIPRHPERTTKIQSIFTNNKIDFTCRSKGENPKENAIYIADTLGETSEFYSISNVIFMGGSLIDVGGHNIIEPAYFKKSIISGNLYYNFEEIFAEFISKDAIIIATLEEIAVSVLKILNDTALSNRLSENAKKIALQHSHIAENFANIIFANKF